MAETINHHTPLADAATDNFAAETFNKRYRELDGAITGTNTTVANHESRLTAAEESIGPLAAYDIWTGTQAAYDALGSYDSTTLYFISG